MGPGAFRRLLCALLCACAGVALAQNPPPGFNRVRFTTYSTAQGLSQATARAIVQDSAGFLWVGTQDGLNRYDGYGFKTYRHDRADPNSLSDNHVWCLAVDLSGAMWIGTQNGGLNRYDADRDAYTAFRPQTGVAGSLAGSQVSALLVDRSGRLWVATIGARLQWFDPTHQNFIDLPLGERSELALVHALLELPDGSVLVASHDGLFRTDRDGRQWQEWALDPTRQLEVYALALAPDGAIWVGSGEHGLWRLDGSGKVLAHHVHEPARADSLPDDAVRGLLVDRDGALWISSNSRGLARLRAGHTGFEAFPHDPSQPQSVAANRLWGLYQDREGLLWVGSWVNGLSVHDPRTEVFLQIDAEPDDPRSFPARPTTSVFADADGTFWAGVLENGGLLHADPERGVLARYTHDARKPDSLAHNFIQKVLRTRDGTVWVATVGGGLNRLRPDGGFDHFRHDPGDTTSIASDNLQTLYEDRAGNLWIGSQDAGVDVLCPGCRTFRHYRNDPDDPSSLGGNTVNAIVETRDGAIWVGLRPGGAARLDLATGRFAHYRPRLDDPSSLAVDTVTVLFEDSRDRLWLGTQGGGLNLYRPATANSPERFESIGTQDGLAADAIGGIAEDAAHRLWMSTTVGLSRVDPETRQVINLSARDGAQQLGYFIGAVGQFADGRVMFGGPGGVVLFNPADVRAPPLPQPIVTDLRLYNLPVALRWRQADSPLVKPLWRGGAVDLNHRQTIVSFEFGALGYSAPEALEYSYRLEGRDPYWILTGADRRFATYTDLPRGDYVLRVRARYRGDDWSPQEATVRMHVTPAPWLSTPALVAYLLAIAALLGLWWQRVLQARRRREEVQEAIRLSEERLKLALWGSGSELWDIDMASGSLHRENRLEHLAASHETREQTLAEYRPFVHPDDLPRFEAALVGHLRGELDAFELSYRTLDNRHEWVWILTHGRVVERDHDGHAVRMSGTTHDINALKQAEEALRKLNEELESRVERRTADLSRANAELKRTLEQLTLAQRQLIEAEKLASLGGLVAGIAHEINTPLGVGVTAASHLQEEARRLQQVLDSGQLKRSDLDRFQHAARETSDLILRNLQRADRLVKSFKQVAVDQSSEDRRVVELGGCLNEILTTLGPTLKKTPHKIAIDCPDPIVLETAPGALYQIVTNLVMNSLTHGYPDGRAGSMLLRTVRDVDGVEIEYRDDGVGMDEAVRAHVFEPFFTTRRGQGGSGLGMHIVYNLVTQVLGGTIRCASAPGAGVAFTIRLPPGRQD